MSEMEYRESCEAQGSRCYQGDHDAPMASLRAQNRLLQDELGRAGKRLSRIYRIASGNYFGASERKRALHAVATIALTQASDISAT